MKTKPETENCTYWFCEANSINQMPEWGLLGGSMILKSELGPATSSPVCTWNGRAK